MSLAASERLCPLFSCQLSEIPHLGFSFSRRHTVNGTASSFAHDRLDTILCTNTRIIFLFAYEVYAVHATDADAEAQKDAYHYCRCLPKNTILKEEEEEEKDVAEDEDGYLYEYGITFL